MEKLSMEGSSEFKDYFHVQKLLLKCIGVSLSPNNGTAYKFYSACALLIISTGPMLTFADVMNTKRSFDYRINSILYLGGCIIAHTKAVILFVHRRNLTNVMETLGRGVFLPNVERGGEFEGRVLKKRLKTGMLQCAGCAGLLFIVAGGSIIASLAKRIFHNGNNQKWILPFAQSSLFDFNKSPNFELLWLYQSVAYPLFGISFITADMIFASVCSHISGHCAILGNCIRRFKIKGQKRSGRIAKDLKSVHRGHNLKGIVIYHNAILKLCKKFEEIYCFILLWHELGTLLILSSALYHLSEIKATDTRFSADITVMTLTIFELVLLSYCANETMLDSQTIGSACFELEFFNFNLSYQKGLMLVIQRSQRPIVFTIGKLAPMTLMVGVAALRTVISYFMVLRNVKANIE